MHTTQQELFSLKTAPAPSFITAHKVQPSATHPVPERYVESPLASPIKSLETTLQRIFPTSQEQTKAQQARRILGDAVESLKDEELEVYLTEFQFLIDNCLDAFEKNKFGGSTIKQLLQEE